MRIAIKAVQIAEGGGLTHLNKMIEWFGRIAPEIEFLLLCKPGQENLFVPMPSNFRYLEYRIPGINLPAQIWWERNILPDLLSEMKCDLLFEPGNRGTLSSPCPKVSLIHNLAPFVDEYLENETAYQKLRQSFLRRATIQSMQKSNGIIFLSKYCQDFFGNYVDLSKVKSRIIYHGKSDYNHKQDDTFIKKYNIEKEYILCVSHIWRYKKIKEMVLSYHQALRRLPTLPPLLIAGANYSSDYMKEIEILINASGYENKIIFTGSVGQAELAGLYSNCRAFLFPSVIETCSIILIEAMAAGCAIICSNKCVMPEVTGGAALYLNPDNINDFASKIISVVTDNGLNSFLKVRSREQAQNYSWEKCATETLNFFDEVLGKQNITHECNPILAAVEG
jgi:glycosyltransferase involved in cell wall biosynthesis